VHNPPPRYNAGENEFNLSLFRGKLGSASASTAKQLKNEEWHSIMLYVLTNLEEVEPYMGKFSTNLFQYAVTILHPIPLFLVGSGNFFITSGI
jgi:hypothetical protein